MSVFIRKPMKATLASCIAITGLVCHAGTDVIDPSFRSGVAPNLRGPDGPVFALAEGSDATVVLAGDFARVNGVPRNALARLLPDGTLDPAFAPNAAPDGAIRSVTVTANGSVIVAGDFSHWGAVAAGDHCVRLKPDGSLDESFTTSPPFTGSITQILSLADQSLLVLGKKSEGGGTQSFLQHRGSDGSVDPGFQPVLSADAALNSLAREASGTLLIAGRFQEFDGRPATNLVRLRADLTLDEGFQSAAAAATGELYGVAAATDGRIAIGGAVTNPFPSSVLGVLTSQGEPDPVFVRPTTIFSPVSQVAFDTAGNLFVWERIPAGYASPYRLTPTGELTYLSFSGSPNAPAPLARSNGHVIWAMDGSTLLQDAVWSWLLETLPDGTVHPQFNPGPGLPGELPWPIFTLARMPDGDVVAPGPSGVRTNLSTGAIAFQQNLVRLDSTGTVEPGFQVNANTFEGGFNDLIPTEDGGLLVAGGLNAIQWDTRSPLVAQLNPDGSLNPDFKSGMKLNDFFWPAWVYSTVRLGDGRVLVAGTYTLQKAVGVNETTLFGRFLPDGSRDPAFKFITSLQTRTSASISAFAVLDSDHYLLWGRTSSSGSPTLFTYSAQGDSTPGPALEAESSFSLRVNQLIRQPDGGILVAGTFERIGTVPRRNLARLLSDLSVDPGFDTGAGPDGPVTAVAALADGRLLVAGAFTHWNGESRRRLVLLNPNGSVDPTFDAGTGPDDVIYKLVEQPDGRVLLGGRFGSVDGRGSPRLARLQIPASTPPLPAQLTVQPTSTETTNSAASLTLRAAGLGTPPLQWQWYRNGSPLGASDGVLGATSPELVIPASQAKEAAAYHVTVSNATGREVSRSVIVGLASGSIDPKFMINPASGQLRIGGSGLPGTIAGLAADRDATGRARRILIYGSLLAYDSVQVPGLVVIRPDGSRDDTWNPPEGLQGTETLAAEFRPDGRLVLAGKFSRLRGAPRDGVVQLKADGSLDETFDPGDELTVSPPAGYSKHAAVSALVLDGDGVFIASASGVGSQNGAIRRLGGSGKTDLSFRASGFTFYGTPTVLKVEPGPEGRPVVGGVQFAVQETSGSRTLFRGVARFLRDGRLDPAFNAKPRRPDTSANGDVNAMIPRDDGHLWVGGSFTEFDRAPGPLVWLDSSGTADTNFFVQIPADPPVRFPGKTLLGMEPLTDGDWLLNFRPIIRGADSVVRMRADGTVVPTSGGIVDTLRNPGPVLALGDGSYLATITAETTFPVQKKPALGRFWLTDLSATPSASQPPVVLRNAASVTHTVRPGIREPLVLNPVFQSGGEVRFRWFLNDTLLDSETGPELRIPSPQPGVHDGRYRVEISNAAGRVITETQVTIVAAPPEAPHVTAAWTSGLRPLRLTFQPAAGVTYQLEASANLTIWVPDSDPDAVVSPGEFAPQVGADPRYFRVSVKP